MAKKSSNKKLLGRILEFVALALAVVTIAMFFVPTIKAKDSDSFSYSASQICFVSADKASENSKDELANGNLEKSAFWTNLSTLKESDDYNGKLNLAGWMGFVSLVGALLVLVAIILKMLKIKARFLIVIASLVMFAGSLGSLIGVSSLMGVEVLGIKFSEAYSYGVGVILGFISSTLSFLCLATKRILRA